MIPEETIWITGASSGIGMALAKAFLSRNVKLIVSGRNVKSLASIETLAPKKVQVLPFDITDELSFQIALRALPDKIDRIILNAGICEYVEAKDLDIDSFRRVFEANYFGNINLFKHTFKNLKKSTAPHLIIMSSSVAWLPIPRAEAYGASKAAINYTFLSMEAYLRLNNIDLSIIYPGFIKTPLTDKNDFPMPLIMTADKAANLITNKIYKRAKEIHFPRRLTCLFKFINFLPRWIQVILMKKSVVRN